MLDATPGGAAANSFVTSESADAYFARRLTPGSTEWEKYALADRHRALMQASSDVNRCRFKGSQAYCAQALQFPRVGQREPLTQIPQAVQDATCEQAVFLLQNQASQGRSRSAQLRAQGVSAFRVGDHSQEFAPGGSRASQQHLCPEASGILQSWISITGRVVRRRPSGRAFLL